MTGQPINLAELRGHAHVNSLGRTIAVDPGTLLALIDAVEAAQALSTKADTTGDVRASTFDLLRDALARFTG